MVGLGAVAVGTGVGRAVAVVGLTDTLVRLGVVVVLQATTVTIVATTAAADRKRSRPSGAFRVSILVPSVPPSRWFEGSGAVRRGNVHSVDGRNLGGERACTA